MYGIIKTRKMYLIVPMEYIKIGNDKVIAIGIKDKTTAKNIVDKIKSKIKLDKQ